MLLRAKPAPVGPPTLHLPYIFHVPLGRDVLNVEWSPQGNALAAVIGNGTAQILVMQQGRYRPTMTIRAVNIATWSPDGTRIASANADDTVRIWNPATGAQVQEEGTPTWPAASPGPRMGNIWRPAMAPGFCVSGK
jgi:WD40 repeat protein